MKTFQKLLIGLCIWVFSFGSITQTFANTGSGIKIQVSQKVPWANCEWPVTQSGSTLYTCTIQPWFSSIMLMLGNFIKYFTAITALAGVLFLVINGIMLSMWGLDSDAKERTKTFITRTILGLLLLVFSWIFLRILAPWVYN